MNFTWDREPIKDSPISAVVTVPTGSTTLKPIIEPLGEVLAKRGKGFEILVIEEGGVELSPEVIGGVRNARGLLSEKPGHGAALRTGVKAAQHPLVFTLPATGEYDAADLAKLLENIDRADVILGTRQGVSRWRYWLVPYLIFGLSFQDVACPVRLYRKNVFKRIPIQSSSGFAEVEILAKANFLGCIFDEAPIAWKPGEKSVDAGTTGDVWRVFNQPNFGPVEVDAPAESEAAETAAASS
jgi:hypothetical protein